MPQASQEGVRTVTLIFERLIRLDSKDLGYCGSWHSHYHHARWPSLAHILFVAIPSLESVTIRVTDFSDLIYHQDTVGMHETPVSGVVTVGVSGSGEEEFLPLLCEMYSEIRRIQSGCYRFVAGMLLDFIVGSY